VAVALTLLLFVLRTVDLAPAWERWLRAAGWLAVLAGSGIALTRRGAAARLAAATVARSGVITLALSIGTPASFAAALLHALVALPAVGLLWLWAAIPWSGYVRSARPGPPPLRSPGFWLLVVILAQAAGLPPTLGGVARSAMTGAMTSWPTADHLLRGPLLLADVATLIAGGALAADGRYVPPLRGRVGWVVSLGVALALCLPIVAPARLIGAWFAPAAAAATGTYSSPLALDGARAPALLSGLLAVVGCWALAQRLRGKEWLPGPGRTIMGAAALGWREWRRRWRRGGWSSAPATAAEALWRRLQASGERAMVILRPLEERYYAGAAVLLAVAIIYIIAR
jgi:formate hydrogenlyase subunit 3/multisubunit Na+/H+ antiporter MnhD subunit